MLIIKNKFEKALFTSKLTINSHLKTLKLIS